jgi:hypothetical protein
MNKWPGFWGPDPAAKRVEDVDPRPRDSDYVMRDTYTSIAMEVYVSLIM